MTMHQLTEEDKEFFSGILCFYPDPIARTIARCMYWDWCSVQGFEFNGGEFDEFYDSTLVKMTRRDQ